MAAEFTHFVAAQGHLAGVPCLALRSCGIVVLNRPAPSAGPLRQRC